MTAKKSMKPLPVKERIINKFGDKVSSEVKDYSHYPFVLEKNRKAKAFLEKHGFPKELRKR